MKSLRKFLLFIFSCRGHGKSHAPKLWSLRRTHESLGCGSSWNSSVSLHFFFPLPSSAEPAYFLSSMMLRDFPGGSDGKSVCLQCRRPGFNPWVRKISWRRKWQPTPVFLPGKSHGQRSLVGYSPWGCKELDVTERLHFSLWYWERLRAGGEGDGREWDGRMAAPTQWAWVWANSET